MERISIFNYEAFYLDFLEGNLSKEDTALLLEFFEANPDLKMEEESLLELDPEQIMLDSSSKEQLKQTLIQDEITAENVSFFMISEAEGLLEETKSNELGRFIETNKKLTREMELYSMVYFEPDTSIVFAEKESLKRKNNPVLWPYITAAAAACVIAFFLVWSSQNNRGVNNNNPAPVIAEDKKEPNEEKPRNNIPVDPTVDKGSNDVKTNQPIDPGENQLEKTNRNQKRIETPPVRDMEKLRPKNLITSLDEKQIEPIAKRIYVDPAPVDTRQDYAMLHFSEMDNPIEPITKMISKQTNSEVDFRRAKKSKNKAHGFFLKIGKFEFSRKKNP